jgi:hypothetical protein
MFPQADYRNELMCITWKGILDYSVTKLKYERITKRLEKEILQANVKRILLEG